MPDDRYRLAIVEERRSHHLALFKAYRRLSQIAAALETPGPEPMNAAKIRDWAEEARDAMRPRRRDA